MKHPTFHCFALSFLSISQASDTWESRQIHSEFFSEDAAFGDLDGDGQGDLASGPFWWKGPDFQKRFQYYEPSVFDVKTYSDNFFIHILDIDEDNDKDIIVFGFPDKEARAYLNPGPSSIRQEKKWPMFAIADRVAHEAPTLADIVPGKLPEIICSRDTAYGYYQAGFDSTQSWNWHAISETGATAKKFDHGLGVGDIDKDGDLDLVERYAWWENPGSVSDATLWTKHQWAEPYGRGGAQIHVYDVDDDGLNDIISSLDGHGYGLAWFRQLKKRGAEGQRVFERHDILGNPTDSTPLARAFSQLHAVALQDIDRDGVMDIVTGKRWYAHSGKDPGGDQAAELFWFRCERNAAGVRFTQHLIHNDSGAGVDLLVADLDNDEMLDVVSANKKGLVIHLQKSASGNVKINANGH